MSKIGIKKFERNILAGNCCIIYCQAMGKYTKIFMKDNVSKIVPENLQKIESTFHNDNFVRTHKSFLVNLQQIESINFSERLIHLKDDHIARISVRNITNLKFLFTNGGKIEGIDFKHRQIRRKKSTLVTYLLFFLQGA
jgi:DNA-binding LytR/AlgR family response regulator